MAENDKINLFKSRRSIRNFDDRPIEDKILTQILEAARWCFSAVNKQPWTLYVIRNRDLISQVARECTSGQFAVKAQVLIAIVGDTEVQPEWYIHDLSFVSLEIALAAWVFGIGTCFIGIIKRDNVKSLLGLKEKDYLLTVLPLGYPKGNIPKPTSRKPLEEIVKYFD